MNETLNAILDQLNTLTAQVKDIIAEKEGSACPFTSVREYIDEGEGCISRITDDGDRTVALGAFKGYAPGVSELASLKNTGNGYIAYFPTYSNSRQENYICMDYDEAQYLLELLTYLRKKDKI